MVPVDDEIPAKISQAISRKVQSANFLNLSVRKAKALIRQLAREAICEAYSEHFPPKVYEVRNDRFGNPEWPDVSVHIANIVGVGTIATVECWIGHDFDDDRALEDVAVRVALKPEVIAFKRVVNAPPAKEPPEHWPTGGRQTPIKILGSNFRTDIGYTVDFGAHRATKVTIADPSTLVVMTPPAEEASQVDIAIRGDDGLAVRIPQGFRYENMGGNVVEQLGEQQQKNQGNLAY
jgi:hypothetical protein